MDCKTVSINKFYELSYSGVVMFLYTISPPIAMNPDIHVFTDSICIELDPGLDMDPDSDLEQIVDLQIPIMTTKVPNFLNIYRKKLPDSLPKEIFACDRQRYSDLMSGGSLLAINKRDMGALELNKKALCGPLFSNPGLYDVVIIGDWLLPAYGIDGTRTMLQKEKITVNVRDWHKWLGSAIYTVSGGVLEYRETKFNKYVNIDSPEETRFKQRIMKFEELRNTMRTCRKFIDERNVHSVYGRHLKKEVTVVLANILFDFYRTCKSPQYQVDFVMASYNEIRKEAAEMNFKLPLLQIGPH